jgi:hypothetical protein
LLALGLNLQTLTANAHFHHFLNAKNKLVLHALKKKAAIVPVPLKQLRKVKRRVGKKLVLAYPVKKLNLKYSKLR